MTSQSGCFTDLIVSPYQARGPDPRNVDCLLTIFSVKEVHLHGFHTLEKILSITVPNLQTSTPAQLIHKEQIQK